MDVSLIQLHVSKGKFKIVAAEWKIIMEIIFTGNKIEDIDLIYLLVEKEANNWSELDIWPSGLDRMSLLNLHCLLFLHHSSF